MGSRCTYLASSTSRGSTRGKVRALCWAWSPDAKYMATGEQDSTVHFWHVKSGRDAQMWGFPTKVRELSWDPSGRWLATGGGASPCLWDCSGKGPMGRKPRQYDAHSNKLTQLVFQSDGELLASADADAKLFLWASFEARPHHWRGRAVITRKLFAVAQRGPAACGWPARWQRGHLRAPVGGRRLTSMQRESLNHLSFNAQTRRLRHAVEAPGRLDDATRRAGWGRFSFVRAVVAGVLTRDSRRCQRR